jgi:ABC-2 type transport system ATP-binding protein
VLTDVIFIDRGRIVFRRTMEEIESRFLELTPRPDQVEAARALKPMHERQSLGRPVMLFEALERQRVAALGEVRTPGIADVFVAVVGSRKGGMQ